MELHNLNNEIRNITIKLCVLNSVVMAVAITALVKIVFIPESEYITPLAAFCCSYLVLNRMHEMMELFRNK